jgi:hypothetical protein
MLPVLGASVQLEIVLTVKQACRKGTKVYTLPLGTQSHHPMNEPEKN